MSCDHSYVVTRYYPTTVVLVYELIHRSEVVVRNHVQPCNPPLKIHYYKERERERERDFFTPHTRDNDASFLENNRRWIDGLLLFFCIFVICANINKHSN